MADKKLCAWCKKILGIDNPIHGYGLSDYDAEQLTADRKTADYFEEAVHEGWKLSKVKPVGL